MREIGSIFEMNSDLFVSNDSYNIEDYIHFNRDNSMYFNSGRTALKYILYSFFDQDEKFLLPSYLCPSVLKPYKELGMKFVFYEIKDDLTINLEDLASKINDNIQGVLLIHYFGFPIDNNDFEKIKKMIQKYKSLKVIEDVTHSMFTQDISIGSEVSDFIFSSIRKWIPIPDGGVVFSNYSLIEKDFESPYNKFSFYNMVSQFIKQNYHYINHDVDKEYYLSLVDRAADYYENSIEISKITDFSREIMEAINYSDILKKRQANFAHLLSNINNLNNNIIKPMFNKLPLGVYPLGFPVWVNKRNELRDYLINHKIYPPIHWKLPEEINQSNEFDLSIKLSNKILTIPCDQRYSIEDMNRIIKVIIEYIKEEGK